MGFCISTGVSKLAMTFHEDMFSSIGCNKSEKYELTRCTYLKRSSNQSKVNLCLNFYPFFFSSLFFLLCAQEGRGDYLFSEVFKRNEVQFAKRPRHIVSKTHFKASDVRKPAFVSYFRPHLPFMAHTFLARKDFETSIS